jgi:hypothetical protein
MSENDWTKSQQGTQQQANNDYNNGFRRDTQNLPDTVRQNWA